ncbi:hypothetical protein D9M73_199860 [compost metagenome]
MAFQRQRHVGRGHAAPVIGHLDQIGAPAGQAHGDARRPGVDRILDQFLQRAGGSFHHFTGSNAIDEMFWQAAY